VIIKLHDQLIKLLKLLADDHFTSGEDLGNQLNLSRAGVWKMIQKIRNHGYPVLAHPNKGYRFEHAVEWLDHRVICEQLSPSVKAQFATLIFDSISSTNDIAFELANDQANKNILVLAEHQASGRGRLGSQWLSPLGHNIYFSMLIHCSPQTVDFGSISLCASLAVARTLTTWIKKKDISIKWPNDVWVKDQKIAGILIESNFEANQQIPLVIGIGINLHPLPEQDAPEHTALYIHTQQRNIRNQVVATLGNQLFDIINHHKSHGFRKKLKQQWANFDRLADKRISLDTAGKIIHGTARGITDTGELIVELDNHETINICSGVAKLVRENTDTS
jgi:BirA family biotin operon repressor/biotin-[acetyl-CoA-carboxylase] ligase